MSGHGLPERRYSEEEAKAILTRALSRKGESGFTRTDLEHMAAELGISPAQLAAAEAEHLAPTPWGHELARLREQFLAERRRRAIGSMGSAVAMLLILGLLTMVNSSAIGFAGFFIFRNLLVQH